MAYTMAVKTPYGVFKRKTRTEYRFAAVGEHRDNPDAGVKVVGNRQGDPSLTTLNQYGNPIERRRYHVAWSNTREGAARNCENFPYDYVKVLGVYEAFKM